MSSTLLVDLDSFYRQQPDTNDSQVYDKEDDWGDFQGSQDLQNEKVLCDVGKPFSNNQVPRDESSGTDLRSDAVNELSKDISGRNILSKPTNSKASIIPKKVGSRLDPATKYKRAANTKEHQKDPSLSDTGSSKISQGLDSTAETDPDRPFNWKVVDSSGIAEEWADFTPTPVVQEASIADKRTNATGISLQSQYKTHEQEVPPTNVPPPALILTLFLRVISESKNELLQLTNLRKDNSHEPSAKDADFLRAYVETGRVLARIIAGRKLRWKRDQLLFQGMKIGPASVKRISGMKLAGVDKAEMGREEKEVLDIVEVWREQLGRLRSLVSAFAKNGFDKIGAIPDIQLNIPVKTLKEIEGGLPSTQSCTLCGLKRNERVHRVDVNVYDSFGEWWIESMNMHRTCKYFWQSHKSKLQSS